jgi:flagellar assembly protein FliH
LSADRSFLVRDVAVDQLERADLFRSHAEPMVEPTGPWAAHLAAVRQAAVDDGFRAGYRDGFDAGVRKADEDNQQLRQSVATASSALVEAIDELHRHDATTAVQLAGEALELAIDLTQLILDREILTCADPGLEAIRRCLGIVPSRQPLVIRLHPDDIALIGDVGGVLAGATYEMVADPAVRRGGVLVDAGPARIDGQVDTALARVAEALGLEIRT